MNESEKMAYGLLRYLWNKADQTGRPRGLMVVGADTPGNWPAIDLLVSLGYMGRDKGGVYITESGMAFADEEWGNT